LGRNRQIQIAAIGMATSFGDGRHLPRRQSFDRPINHHLPLFLRAGFEPLIAKIDSARIFASAGLQSAQSGFELTQDVARPNFYPNLRRRLAAIKVDGGKLGWRG
jgi:hypothetical protein